MSLVTDVGFNSPGTTSITVPKPSGTQVGDLLVVALTVGPSNPSVAAPVGWDRVGSYSFYYSSVYVYTRLWTSEDVGFTFTLSLTAPVAGTVLLYRGEKSALQPATGVGSTGAGSYSYTVNGLTPVKTTDRELIVAAAGSATSSSYPALSVPLTAGQVPPDVVQQLQSGTSNLYGMVWDRPVNVLAGTQVATFTQSSTNGGGGVAVRLILTDNQPPYAPTVTVPAVVDRTQPLVVPVRFNDVGDSASRSALFYRRTDLTPLSAWSSIVRQSPNTDVTIPADTLAAAPYELQGQSTDSLGLTGPRSGSVFLTAVTPAPAPVFTDPVQGETIGTSTRTFTVSVPELDSLEWRVLADLNGQADPDVVIASGTVSDPTARTFTATGLPNGTSVHAQARAVLDGLPGAWGSTFNPVQFTAPRVPLAGLGLVSDGRGGSHAIAVFTRNPAPTGTQPRVSFHYLHRRTLDAAGEVLEQGRLRDLRLGGPLMVTPGGSYTDFTVAKGRSYAYAAESVGENGTSVLGEWVTDTTGLPDVTEPPTDEGRFADSRFSPDRFD